MKTTPTIRTLLGPFSGILFGVLYALLTRWAFTVDTGEDPFLSTMTCSFLIFVPVAVGALTIYFSPPESRSVPSYTVFMPWFSCIIIVFLLALLRFEALVCIAMALPVFLPLSSLGGYSMRLKKPAEEGDSLTEKTFFGLILLAPYLLSPVETRLPLTASYRVVENSIVIHAPVDTVWQNIITVPLIRPEEQGFSIFHLLGLPKPLEATLSHPGIGGVRNATFEHNLTFVETITQWEDHHSLSFSIVRQPELNLPMPLDQIGGDYFDVLNGTYTIERVSDNEVILHLKSTHRLSTRFNLLGGFWTEYIMSDLQSYILDIIQARAEQQNATTYH